MQTNVQQFQLDEQLENIFVPLHRIIPFSNVEGQGNRTSIFLQGCKLNCLYCHNPETITRYSEDSKLVSLQYLYEKIMEAKPFIRGVTVSGGEPTIHYKKLIPLFKKLKQEGLTCYLDSSGFFDYEKTKLLLDVTDKVLFDLKGEGAGLQQLCFDRKNQRGIVPQEVSFDRMAMRSDNLQRNFNNLVRLLKLGKIEEVRLVYLNGFFDAAELIKKVSLVLKDYPDVLLKIIRVHSQGTRDPQGLANFIPSIEETKQLAQYAKLCGVLKVVTIL